MPDNLPTLNQDEPHATPEQSEAPPPRNIAERHLAQYLEQQRQAQAKKEKQPEGIALKVIRRLRGFTPLQKVVALIASAIGILVGIKELVEVIERIWGPIPSVRALISTLTPTSTSTPTSTPTLTPTATFTATPTLTPTPAPTPTYTPFPGPTATPLPTVTFEQVLQGVGQGVGRWFVVSPDWVKAILILGGVIAILFAVILKYFRDVLESVEERRQRKQEQDSEKKAQDLWLRCQGFIRRRLRERGIVCTECLTDWSTTYNVQDALRKYTQLHSEVVEFGGARPKQLVKHYRKYHPPREATMSDANLALVQRLTHIVKRPTRRDKVLDIVFWFVVIAIIGLIVFIVFVFVSNIQTP